MPRLLHLQQRDITDHCSEWGLRQSSEGGDVGGHGEGEGDTVSGNPFFFGVRGGDGAPHRSSGGRRAGASISSPVEAGQQPFPLHPQHILLHHPLAGDAQLPLRLYLRSPLLWSILHWFGAKNPVCQEETKWWERREWDDVKITLGHGFTSVSLHPGKFKEDLWFLLEAVEVELKVSETKISINVKQPGLLTGT